MTPIEIRTDHPRNEAMRQGMLDAAEVTDGRQVPLYHGPCLYEYRRAFDWWRAALAPENQADLSHVGWGKVSPPRAS